MLLLMDVLVFFQFVRLPPIYDFSHHGLSRIDITLLQESFYNSMGIVVCCPVEKRTPLGKNMKDFTTYYNLSSQSLTYIAAFTIDIRFSLPHDHLYLANVLS